MHNRKNWLFAGSDEGGLGAAAIYSLLGLRHVLDRLPDHPINRIDELLPWKIAVDLPDLRIAA